MDYFELGQRIRRYRRACNMSQEQLAEKASISTTHMSHIETGNTKLSLPVLVDIANALNVRTDEIIHGMPKTNEHDLKEEITDILDSCAISDLHVLLDAMKAIKKSLEQYKNIPTGSNQEG